MTIFLSDLLFAELPFAVVSVALRPGGRQRVPTSRPWAREMASFALAAIGFLLRTTGVALLAAWVMDALMRRRWRFAARAWGARLVPIVLWQAHVERVRASDEYRRPAYSYQRAPYQYYNVSYAENVLLIDPFRPELGRTGRGGTRGSVGDELGQNAGGPWRGGECAQALLAIGSRAHEPPAWPTSCCRSVSYGCLSWDLGLLFWPASSSLPAAARWLIVFIIPRFGRACLHDALARSIYTLSGAAGSLSDNRCCIGLVLRSVPRCGRGNLRWATSLGRLALASILVLAFIVQALQLRNGRSVHQSATSSSFVPEGE